MSACERYFSKRAILWASLLYSFSLRESGGDNTTSLPIFEGTKKRVETNAQPCFLFLKLSCLKTKKALRICH
jgi:hypothetical protein